MDGRESTFLREHTHEDLPSVSAHAERLMRRWSTGLEVQERIEHEKEVAKWAQEVHPYIAVSREVGAGGEELSKVLATRLGWECMDRRLMDLMAEQYGLPEGTLRIADEAKSNWLRETFAHWLDKTVITESAYVSHLGQIVLMAAKSSCCVFVGRGIQYLLPGDKGLSVRVVAPLAQRVAAIRKRNQMDEKAARKFIEETEEARREFVQHCFHHDVADADCYDLVVNLGKIPLDDAVEMIATVAERRFPIV